MLFFVYSGAIINGAGSPSPSAVLCLVRVLVQGLDVKADRPEAVVTADHSRLGILHPAIVEIAATVCQRHHKGRHALPCTVAHSIRLLPAISNPDLTFLNVT